MPLNTVYQSQFTSLYKEIQGNKIDIYLQCPDEIDVYITLTDASQPANRADILTLSGESTAKGFGIRLYKNSDVTAISYGEDSPVKGNGSQRHLSDYREEVNPHIDLRANYIKVVDVTTSGSVKAIATITFSYQ